RCESEDADAAHSRFRCQRERADAQGSGDLGSEIERGPFPFVLGLVVSCPLVPGRRQPQLLPSGPFQWQWFTQREQSVLSLPGCAVPPQHGTPLSDEPGRTIALRTVVVRLRPAVARTQFDAQPPYLVSALTVAGIAPPADDQRPPVDFGAYIHPS